MDDHLQKGISKLNDEEKRILYGEYSQWARHYHTLVWTTAALAVSIVLGGVALLRDTGAVVYTFVGLGCIALLVLFHRIAEGNRTQWADGVRVMNAVEVVWGVRDNENNPHGPLSKRPSGSDRQATRHARRHLFLTSGVLSIIAVILKWWQVLVTGVTIGGS